MAVIDCGFDASVLCLNPSGYRRGWFNMRDFGAMFEHEEPVPHSVQAAVLIRPDVCFGAHYGLNSDIALGPKGAITGLLHRSKAGNSMAPFL